MRVLVTGATGFVGAWSAKALADAGHRVRLLVRNPARLATSAALIGVDTRDYVIGDITDGASVAAALEGCQAALHCAAIVATDPRRAKEILETNLLGARNVLGQAVNGQLDPVVHVSSFTALFQPGLQVLRADLPVVGGGDAYGRSKAEVERYARGLQEAGAPVTITYPGMVLGPPAGDQFGEAAEGVEAVLRMGAIPGQGAAWTVVDVRDVAKLHAALIEADRGPRRYMCGGTYVSVNELARLLGHETGRRLRIVPIPGPILRRLGRAIDLVSQLIPFETPLTEAAMAYYTQMPRSDDQPSVDELGVTYRPTAETLADTISGLIACERVTPSQAGR